MNENMKKLQEKAKKTLAKEQSFDSKEAALQEAIKQSRNLDSGISIWHKDGDYKIVNVENREEAFILGYEEVCDTGVIYDKVKEQTDRIKEI